MATVSAINTGNQSYSTLDALWTLIMAQPKKIQRILANRLETELTNNAANKAGLDEAIEDIKKGCISGPYQTKEELFKHLGI